MRSPGEMVSAVPYLLGFVPTDSLVIVVLDSSSLVRRRHRRFLWLQLVVLVIMRWPANKRRAHVVRAAQSRCAQSTPTWLQLPIVLGVIFIFRLVAANFP